MNIYEIKNIEHQMNEMAELNEGEIPDQLMQKFIEIQLKNEEQVDKLVKYIKHLESFIKTCKDEESRIKKIRERCERRIESIKNYLTPYVKDKGKLTIGTFNLSTRSSKYVELDEDFNNPDYEIEQNIKPKYDKNKIKKDLKAEIIIPGAKLKEKDNLQIK